jgi:hypothetical protein
MSCLNRSDSADIDFIGIICDDLYFFRFDDRFHGCEDLLDGFPHIDIAVRIYFALVFDVGYDQDVLDQPLQPGGFNRNNIEEFRPHLGILGGSVLQRFHEAEMDVSGVFSSWVTFATKSFLICSAFLFSSIVTFSRFSISLIGLMSDVV